MKSEFARFSHRIKAEPVEMPRRVITLPWPNKGLSPNARIHWSQKARLVKAARKAAYYETLIAGHHAKHVEAGKPLHVWITFYAPDKRHRDQDNMLAALKPTLDGIADALQINDRDFVLHPIVSGHVYQGGRVEVVLTRGPDA